jgi:hypothetical protein
MSAAAELGHFPGRCFIGQDGQLNLSNLDALTAHSGGGQTSALKLVNLINRVSTVAAAADSVALPPAIPGLTVCVINSGANPMQVFGDNGYADTINDVATATGVSQMQNSCCYYTCPVAGKWYSDSPGVGYNGSLPTYSAADALTAGTTQTQAGGLAITAAISRFTTVANNGDACTLPVSAPGMELTIINAGAHSLQVFPNAGGTTTEQINALGANAALSMATTKVATLYCTVAGQWHSILTA